MRTSIISILFYFIAHSFISQGNVGPSNVIIPSGNPNAGVIDGVYEKKDVLAKKRAIPYEFVRESDYVWGKRTWSYIDLREKINHPLYYPHEKIDPKKDTVLQMAQGRYSLFFILRNALKLGLVMGYYDQIEPNTSKGILKPIEGGDAFTLPARRNYALYGNPVKDTKYQEDIDEMIASTSIDPQRIEKVVPDPNGGPALKVFHKKGVAMDIKVYSDVSGDEEKLDPSTETTNPADAEPIPGTSDFYPVEFRISSKKNVMPQEIIKYVLKEDWFFDKERSILDVRTIGLAPVIMDSATNKEKIKFWVYFPQARDVLKNYYVYDAKSTVGGNTFDHLFMTRRFNAVVYKESTLYDRKIEDYRFGADALYESEKVKNTIRTFEHDVWNF